MIDMNAPIIPWIGLGNIKLYETIKNIKPLIAQENVKGFLYDKFLIRYELEDEVYLFFNLLNGKLFKLTALKNYKGMLLNQIKIGMNIRELLKIEPSFEYEDFEEVYVSPKGIFVEINPDTEDIMWISVFIRELETPNFMQAEW